MIGYIKGTVEELFDDSVIVECGGMGFLIFVPADYPYERLRQGDDVRLYTYMSVREDDISLFGFLTKDDLDAYKKLLGVNGVGPKAAMGILSVMDADRLRLCIMTDDAAAISRAPGIGKKMAQKIILELKDKFSMEDLSYVQEVTYGTDTGADQRSDAVLALTALGYSRAESQKAVGRAAAQTGSTDTETLIKAALKILF